MSDAKYPIYLIVFPSRYLMAATFLRFQEYYESPKFRGRVFDWETFMDWYAALQGGFTYLQDWGGFNIPSRVLRPFYEGKFDPLTRKERWLLDRFRRVTGRFYIVGVEKDGTGVLDHEFVHGMFSVFPGYAASVRKVLRRHDLSELHAWFGSSGGYHPRVFADESNAYLLTGLPDELQGRYAQLGVELDCVFVERFGWSVRDPKNASRIRRLIHRIDYDPTAVARPRRSVR